MSIVHPDPFDRADRDHGPGAGCSRGPSIGDVIASDHSVEVRAVPREGRPDSATPIPDERCVRHGRRMFWPHTCAITRCELVADRDGGAADALGLVVLVVPMMLFAVLVFFLGRNIDVNAQLRAAAEASAQAAALERDPVSAQAAANAAAQAMLDRTDCTNPSVSVAYPDDAPATGIDVGLVEVTVTCGVTNDGFEAFQDHDASMSARAAATIDYFRARR